VTTQPSNLAVNSARLSPKKMADAPPHICICICTFRRRELLARLLTRLRELQKGTDVFSFSCVVVDNDENGSAAEMISSFQNPDGLKITYQCEPERNFAIVRNRAVRAASGDYIAFIDDDEAPEKDWLLRLLETCNRYGCDGALGPVRPYFEKPAPRWLEKSKLCDRPVHPTGLILNWQQTRSGNVLLRRDIFESDGLWFDPAYRTGGEDVDFFKRAIAAGRRFVWCEEAPAYEFVPVERMRLAYHLKRALLQGRISLKYATDKLTPMARLHIGAKSIVAIFCYTLALPVLALPATGLTVKYLIKNCHHLGRLFALLALPVWEERNF